VTARHALRNGPLVPQLETLLAEFIRVERWAVGTRIPSEAELAAELGVGRSSVREAVRLLAKDGLVDVRHGVGTFVARPVVSNAGIDRLLSRARLLEVYEVRRALEIEAARLAAERAGPQDLDRLRAHLVRRHESRAEPSPVFVAMDLEFHATILEIAGNSILSALFESIRPQLLEALTDLVDNVPGRPDTHCAHDDLVRALESGDADAAVAATAANLDPVLRILRKGDS
jgi:DNA-binding FadR family transcriptional regulator